MRHALVTGAGRGIGRHVVLELAARGYAVTAGCRRDAHTLGEQLSREAGRTITTVELDVTDPASVTAAAQRIPHVDVLVNNAGVLCGRGQDALSVPSDAVRESFEVNLFGSWNVMQAFVPAMVEAGWGRVVVLSSGAASFHNGLPPLLPAYAASKVALNALTCLLAGATRNSGVVVNAINPGRVRTDMMPTADGDPAAAAADIADAVAAPGDGPSGEFLRSGQIIDW